MTNIFVGIDVSKNKFDICVLNNTNKTLLTFDNTDNGIKKFITSHKQFIKELYVVLEATGGYEVNILKKLTKAGIRVHRADTNKMHNFLKSFNKFSKTDSIDAYGIAQYGKERYSDLKVYSLKDDALDKLSAYTTRISQLKEILVMEKNRLKAPNNNYMQKSIKYVIQHTQKSINDLQKQINTLIESNSDLKAKKEILTTVAGIGPEVSTALLNIQELGGMNREQVASYVGVAPYPKESGNTAKYRATMGGNRKVRKLLFNSALTAIRGKNEFADFYNRLLEKGKKKLVALVAVMRKIVIVANAKMRDFLNKLAEQPSNATDHELQNNL